MDTDLALAAIDSFARAIEHYQRAVDGDDVGEWDSLNESIRTELFVVRAIARDVAPHLLNNLQSISQAFDHQWANARTAAVDLRAVLTEQDRVTAILGPAGPQLAASALHPQVWASAAALWDGGHHRQAVQTAGAALEGLLQAATGRPDVGGKDLANAFSSSPPDDKWPQRLRFPEIEPTSQTWKSAHDGAAALVRGAFMFIRNLSSHPGAPDLPETEALEQLAVLSLIARMLGRAELTPA